MDAMGTITFGFAAVGAVLGVMNTWRAFDRDRVKLKITPAHAIPVGGAAESHSAIQFSIEVINLSSFPVTVLEVGFLHRGTKSRGVVVQPITFDGATTPRKLDAREAASFYMAKPALFEGRPLTHAYARTACGRIFKGSSPALQQINSQQ